MAVSRQQKTALLERYEEGLARAPHAFVVSFDRITVGEVTELRSRLRARGGQYVVVKNRLALRALEGAALDGLRDRFRGPTAVVYASSDPVGIAKVLSEFAKDVPRLEFKGGVVDGKTVSPAEIVAIATLPSRQELVAKLLFLLQSPVSRFVRTLAAVPRGLVVALDQVRRQKEEQEGGTS
jgi:large subunit ribosomal protein L10